MKRYNLPPTNFSEVELKRSNDILRKVLSEFMMIDDDDATLTNVLSSCGVTEDGYIEEMRRMISIIYRRKPNKTIISPYNTMLLNLIFIKLLFILCYLLQIYTKLLNFIKFNTNLTFVTAVYGLLAYICLYISKKEIMCKVVK